MASSQHGVFSRSQAAALGVTRDVMRRRVGSGRWEVAWPGVFRPAGAPCTWRQSLMVACLAWGPGAVISHAAAGALGRLVGFAPGAIELTVPRKRDRSGPGIVHRGLLLPHDSTVIDGIPVTSPARTLIDLAGAAPQEAVEEALDDALRRGIVSIAQLRRRIDQLARKGRPGIVVIRSLLSARADGTGVPMSVFETRLLRELRKARLPRPIAQYRIRLPRGGVALIDFAWIDRAVALEADGFRWHSGRRRFDSDRTRRNQLTLLGWRVIHVTWTDLTERPRAVMETIATALRP